MLRLESGRRVPPCAERQAPQAPRKYPLRPVPPSTRGRRRAATAPAHGRSGGGASRRDGRSTPGSTGARCPDAPQMFAARPVAGAGFTAELTVVARAPAAAAAALAAAAGAATGPAQGCLPAGPKAQRALAIRSLRPDAHGSIPEPAETGGATRYPGFEPAAKALSWPWLLPWLKCCCGRWRVFSASSQGTAEREGTAGSGALDI